MLLHNQSVNQIEFVKRGSIKSEVLLPFHCVLAAMLSYRPTCVRWTAQEAGDRWQIRGFRAAKLCREQREKVSSRLGGTVKKAVHLIFGGISLHAHKPSPCPFIYVWSDSSSIKSIKLPSSIFFLFFPSVSEFAKSVPNIHEVIGHCCIPFPLITQILIIP